MRAPLVGRLISAYRAKHPVLRFVLLLVLFTVVFNALFYLYVANSAGYDTYLNWNARASAMVLRLFGDDAVASGTAVNSSRYGVDIRRGCDAIQVTAFFVFGVLASPVPVSWRQRAVVAALGAGFLLAVNLVRIISLYYTGIYFPSAFEIMHIDVWQPAFIFLTIFLWVAWAWRALRTGARRSHVVA